ncbi:meiosis protein SPO22/ZIP4 like-domain-containing protein [Xylaria nigripes]|nr:meiosis protein SPO22/ZIP4 like-domain-containing protein [Xylaria nigripes]
MAATRPQFATMQHSNKSSTAKHKTDQLVDAVIRARLRSQSFDKLADPNLRDLNDEIENQIHALRAHSSRSLSTEQLGLLNSAGLGLWNWCTQGMRREDDKPLPALDRFFCLVRVLSFSMLILAQRVDESPSRPIIIHLERLAIKTGRSCIANNELDLGLWALQKAVEYNGVLQHMQHLPSEESYTCCYFEAWKEDRMDVAEHLYASVEKLIHKTNTVSIENLSDAVFEIGRDLAQKKNYSLAIKWIERAHDLINGQDITQLSRDAIELRFAISQALIQVYLDVGTPDYIDRAENHIAYIENEVGEKLIVLLFRAEVLLRSPAEVFDSKGYADILRRMMKAVDMSESSFKLLMHHIRKLDEKCHPAAVSVLDEFLKTCILATLRESWIDKAIILLTHMTIRDGSLESIEALGTMYDQVEPSTGKLLSANTAAGIQALLWKKADAEFSQDQFDSASQWCKLALHSVLEKSGPSNASKMARKMLLCAIQQNNLPVASDILQTMSDATLREPMTAYLAFKVALKQQDADGALRCLRHVSDASLSDPQYLFACCLEAQQAQDKIITIEVLRCIVAKNESLSSSSIHLPALLRALIRLEVSVLRDEKIADIDRSSLAEDICNIFNSAVKKIKADRQDNKSDKVFNIDELNWFCKNAYNLGLENSMVWEARHVIAVLECCLSIISSYPPDIPAQTVADISLRGLFCNFMAATVLLALARSEDNIESRLQNYLSMRCHVQHFYTGLEPRLEALDETSREDLLSKFSTLLVFEFEAATCLKS